MERRPWELFISKTVLESILRNATWKPNMNVLIFWKLYFCFFANFWVAKLKSYSGKSTQKPWDCLDQIFVIGSILKKYFPSYLETRNACSENFKIELVTFSQIFEWWSWNRLLGKSDKASKGLYIKSFLLGTFRKWFFLTSICFCWENIIRVFEYFEHLKYFRLNIQLQLVK